MIAPGATPNILIGATEDVLQEAAVALEPVADRLHKRRPNQPMNPERPPSPISAPVEDPTHGEVNIMARVLHDYEAQELSEISIKKGEFVLIKEHPDKGWDAEDKEWCYGFVLNKPANQYGNFPRSYVEEIDENTMVDVDDTDFVPEGFHENCRDENGAVKITKENYHLYQDVGHLIKKYNEEGWGQEEGVLYTKEMTGCPEGRVPTLESLMSLQLSGYKLHGRIIMTKNDIFDADTQNKLARLTPEKFQDLMMDFQKKNMWEKMNSESEPSVEYSLAKDVDGIVDDGYHMKIPKGKYVLKDISYKKSEEGISQFCLCDEPTCCLMSMALIGFSSTPTLPREMKDDMLNYFKKRNIYQSENEKTGNIEMCRYCLEQSVYV